MSPFSSRCMLELKFVTEQVCPHMLPQISRCMQYYLKNHRPGSVQMSSQQWMKKTLPSLSPCTPTIFLIQQSWVIIAFPLLSDMCTCVQVKKWHRKWIQMPCETSKLWKAIGWCIAQCKMLPFCVKIIIKELCSSSLSEKKKKKREKSWGGAWEWGYIHIIETTFVNVA